MTRIIAFFVFFMGAGAAQLFGQFGNEWINANQPYVRIPVGKDGMYRISYTELEVSGFPVGSINPINLKLYHRGIEQRITVQGEGDGQFNNNDVIEFYGRRNDGTLDAELYKPTSVQPHQYYNLYSDTTSYFLTAGSSAGKRIALFNETNTGGLTAETFHWDDKLMILSNNYSSGVNFAEMQNSYFDEGEGWTGSQLSQGSNTEYLITQIIQGVPSGGLPKLEISLMGRNSTLHKAEIYAGAAQRLVATLNFSGYQTIKHVQDLEWNDIAADGRLSIRVKVIGVPGYSSDRLSVNYIKILYPQQTNATGINEKFFLLRENPANKSYVEIANPAAGLQLYDITDPNNVVRIGTTQTSTLNAIIPSTSVARKILATNTFSTTTIRRVVFRDIDPNNVGYVIISHALLRSPASGYSDPVKAYAEYRASDAGGGYDTLVMNIDQVFDQFSYGEQTPLAIYRLMKYLASTNVPDYLFLIGKGLDINYRYYRQPGSYSTYKDFVPTAGYPGSDIAFTAGLGGTTYEAGVPTGRITAVKSEDVAAYLNKVKEMEALPYNDLWRKNILHLSGGIAEGEPQLFRAFMSDFESIARTHHLGGEVKAIAKKSTDIQLINIAEEVNKGLNLVTFFGHSSPSTLDFDIGNVTDPVMGYNNKGKYPMLLMNGCNAGSFFLNKALFGENWINTPNKGAVGFIGHSAYGLVFYLKRYTDIFYQVGYGDSVFIKKGIGDIHQELGKRFLTTGSSLAEIAHVQQMILLADPAVHLFGAPKPDYEIKNENLYIESFDGKPVTAASDSFALKFITRNFGMAKPDSFRIEVVRTLQDGSAVYYDSIFPSVLNSDTIVFMLRGIRKNGFGNNVMTVHVDADDLIDELREDNNTASLNYFIPLNGTQNLYPKNFAIVNTSQLNLSFQNTDLLSGEREFLLEVDTIDTFSSPYKKSFTVKGTVLAKQGVTLISQDTLVYYWRTKFLQPAPNESFEWTVSSFTFINNGPEGWAQVHFPQYNGNTSVGLVKDPVIRKLKFEASTATIDIRTFGWQAGKPTDSVSVRINNAEYNLTQQGFICRNHTINLIAFDRRSTVPYLAVPFEWYNRFGRACGRGPWVINSFNYNEMVTGNGDDLIRYVDNVAPGDSVVLFSIGHAAYDFWPAAAKTKLGELGISTTQINNLQSTEPVVIFGKKGAAPGTAKIYQATTSPLAAAKLVVNESITGKYSNGEMKSALVGPAKQWKKLFVGFSEKNATNDVSFDVIGVSLNGTEQVLKSLLTIDTDLSDIDVTIYPYLKILFKTSDDINLTPVQLNHWFVTYESVAEGMILFAGDKQPLTLPQGEPWSGDYKFVNISNKNFSRPLLVNYRIVNATDFSAASDTIEISAPAPGDTTRFSIGMNTGSLQGMHDVEVFVNPHVQPEDYYDNNVMVLNDHLNILPDIFAPVLDVTIDGRHIEKDDFVAVSPSIKIMVWDENPNLQLTDTTGVNLFLAFPCEDEDCLFQRINFSRNDISWKAATGTSPFQVDFTPDELPEGKYTLKVEAGDVKKNASGVAPYEISFQVKHDHSVTLLAPYPNPFKHETSFRFILTGNILPESFSLEIFNVSGNLIERFNDDHPDLHIGTNAIRWSAVESRVLPGGVYVYRLILTTEGKPVEKRGKVILLR